MVSKSQIKRITALRQKKYRQSEQLFFAEGTKVIGELLQSGYALEHLYQTGSLFTNIPADAMTIVSDADIKKMSALATPNNCLAVFKIPRSAPISKSGLILALDDIRDPGNFGTIIRLCDWFGIGQIVCSPETVDAYNPKVVQATMGSIARAAIHYTDIAEFLRQTHLPIYGAFMDGANIYAASLPENAVIVIGNEANGISEKIEKGIENRIAIPRFGKLQQTESLNAAMATAIILSEFRRNQ